MHEEHAVAIAHGYARVTGRPMAVALHANVGLMHATMAIFNAWCDRIPIFMLGGVGPMDAVKRRPWVDWIHTSRDLGALIRGYIKWDDQPGVGRPPRSKRWCAPIAYATTAPCGPVFVNLDATIQEEPSHGVPMPPLESLSGAGDRRPAGRRGGRRGRDAGQGAATVAHDRTRLERSRRLPPPRAAGRTPRRARADRLQDGRQLSDHASGLHPHAPGLYVSSEAGILIREADVIVSLDWVDLAGSLRQACGGETPTAKIVQCSVDQYSHHGWNMDYQSLPPTDVTILSSPDRLVSCLLATIEERAPRPSIAPPAHAAVSRLAGGDAEPLSRRRNTCPSTIWRGRRSTHLPRIARRTSACRSAGRGNIAASSIRRTTSASMVAAASARDPEWRSARRWRCAAATACRSRSLGDGDYLMGLTALWTGVHNRVPLLVIVSNNQSFFNDELHQERVARTRGRPIENRWIGLRMDGPRMNLATLAQGQGAIGLGPVRTVADLQEASRPAWRACGTARCASSTSTLLRNTRARCRRR